MAYINQQVMEYTPQDEIVIEEKWQELVEACRKAKICKREDDWQFIKRAYFLAKEAHKGVRRRSGEPYVVHPIEVALIAVREIGLGKKSVVAALLHDVVEDTDYTVEDIARIFSPKIASMVDGLTKMAGVFNSKSSEQAEYFRKLAFQNGLFVTCGSDYHGSIRKSRFMGMETRGGEYVKQGVDIIFSKA